ncbi:hypothetical protein B9T25_06265 [Acinetobacter sp. ANC 4470]|uniref:hypothetical protein n=1 Tax=Acinetobacter sp. ANC 4470 TaxID=1977881 RepID=UPI000A33F5CD|nr:hypothetical protein [Acinetobacter sp. ANC 4470]OTG68282.1 hypothetical protein B9T25_06265 [Acinetobacter sp. ANC 4470]
MDAVIKTLNLSQGKKLMNASIPHQKPRQRVWLAIRKWKDDFTLIQVAEEGSMKEDSTRDYLTGLLNAGYIEVAYEEPIMGKRVKRIHYKLVRDVGYNAPAVKRDGTETTPACINKAMWNTLRILKRAINADELASLSSNDLFNVSVHTANTYLQILNEAGYLKLVQPAINMTGKKAKYQLLECMNTGPDSPQIQRAKQVFDPNTNQLMYSERPELEEEIKHGTLLLTQEEIDDE